MLINKILRSQGRTVITKAGLLRLLRTKETKHIPDCNENSLGYDLCHAKWIIKKVKKHETYSQNLYAALCNNQFIKYPECWAILREESWQCSWVQAVTIIANMRGNDDHLYWLGSGIAISGTGITMQERPKIFSFENFFYNRTFLREGTVSKEVEKDLKKLGWIVKT